MGDVGNGWQLIGLLNEEEMVQDKKMKTAKAHEQI